jgi:CheY-like chemotaxis protein
MGKKNDFKIMIIDDDEKFVKMLAAHLEEYNTVGFVDAFVGLDQLKKEHFDLLILDYLLVDITGAQVVAEIRKFNKDTYIFLLTGCDQKMLQPLNTLRSLDIQFYCEKTVQIENTLINIESAIKSIDFLKTKKITLASRLKELRKIKGVGQGELAQVLGVKRTAVTNWESGLAEPSINNLKNLSSYFKVGIDYLLVQDFTKK